MAILPGCQTETPMKWPCPIETNWITKAAEGSKERFILCTKEELEERTSRLKVQRIHIQARLGAQLQQRYEMRLWSMSDEGKKYEKRHEVPEKLTLQMDNKANVLTLTGLEIFPKVGLQGGETIIGNLEVHANGFVYATSSPKCGFHFLYKDVRKTFFRDGDEKMLPLLHFHLDHPIKVGAEMRQDIQFRLVQTPVVQRTSSGKRTRDWEDLKDFVYKVEKKWSRYVFGGSEVLKRNEFQGNLLPSSKAPTIFGLTLFNLVGLVNEPFVFVSLNEIEIVSLRLKPEPAVVDMTIVFQDFNRDLVHINSIPITSLGLIQDCCNFNRVKYFVIDQDLDWDSIVKGIADSPREFFENGGWSFYGLENSVTAELYRFYKKAEEVEEYELYDSVSSDHEGEDTYNGSDYES